MIQIVESMAEKLKPFAEKMKAEALPEVAINTFFYYYQALLNGETGFIPENSISPVTNIADAETLPSNLKEVGQSALGKTVLIKLNGGLGTSMGLEQAKSLLMVKNNLSFLDIIVHQTLQINMPLILMNSFATQADSLTALKKHSDLAKVQGKIPFDFVQHKVPKINQATLDPISWPKDPDHEWCPPGHGDIYTAMITSGMLDTLLAQGYQYAFVSNADNLGAVMDTAILGYFVHNQIPFMMEVADRTLADRKGGHLAQLLDGQLILRESAQCPPDDQATFQDIKRHKYFNTNNLWLNLTALKKLLDSKDNILGLPMIRNSKTVDPRDKNSPPVYQLETAMGSAIAVFKGAQAIRVPRTRFAPVKTTNDLLAVRSDAYCLTSDFYIVPNPARKLGQIVIDLDSNYYKLISSLESRFPAGTPSLVDCKEFTVEGDIKFGANVTLKGKVNLTNPTPQQYQIEANTTITDTVVEG